MQISHEARQLRHRGGVRSRAQSLAGKTLALVGAGIVLVSAIAVSLLLFAVAMTAVVVIGGYVWWKSRHFRKQLRTQRGSGDVIEGVVVREVDIKQIKRH
jgi:hypothetical protein